jgi:hypothetical protein
MYKTPRDFTIRNTRIGRIVIIHVSHLILPYFRIATTTPIRSTIYLESIVETFERNEAWGFGG